MSSENNYEELNEPLKILIEDIEKMHDLIEVAQSGLKMAQNVPNIVKVLAKAQDEPDSETHKAKLENAERIADIAKKEIDLDFPFLHSQLAIMLYSYLEGAIKRFITTYFKKNDCQKIKEVSNIKVIFSEFMSLTEDEKFKYLFIQYEKNVAIGLQYGVTRFETLLNPIGFSGEVEANISKSIFELSQIRNTLLHRGGKADRQLISNCPWLGYSIGDKIAISRKQYEELNNAVGEYLLLLVIRLGEKRGQDMSEYKRPK